MIRRRPMILLSSILSWSLAWCIGLGSMGVTTGCSPDSPREVVIHRVHRKLPNVRIHHIEGTDKEALQQSLMGKPFKYTAKAACQIKEFKLTLDDVRTAVSKGKVSKFETKNEEIACPLFALVYAIPGKGKVTILAADCKESTKIVRVAIESKKANC